MSPVVHWRRVSDWKQAIVLVDLADVEPAILAALDLVRPEGRLRARFPGLARLVASTRFVQVDRPLAKRLHEAGVSTYEVGYHRVSDGLFFAEESRDGRRTRDVDIARLVGELVGDRDDDDAWSRTSDDAVDAALRVISDGLLTERAVIVAAVVPSLSARGDDEEESLSDYETLGSSELPDVAPELVDRVATALSAIAASPRSLHGPALLPEARRAYQRKAAVVAVAALAVALLGWAYAPWLAVFALPVLVLCGIVIAIHAFALRAPNRGRSQRGRG